MHLRVKSLDQFLVELQATENIAQQVKLAVEILGSDPTHRAVRLVMELNYVFPDQKGQRVTVRSSNWVETAEKVRLYEQRDATLLRTPLLHSYHLAHQALEKLMREQQEHDLGQSAIDAAFAWNEQEAEQRVSEALKAATVTYK